MSIDTILVWQAPKTAILDHSSYFLTFPKQFLNDDDDVVRNVISKLVLSCDDDEDDYYKKTSIFEAQIYGKMETIILDSFSLFCKYLRLPITVIDGGHW